MNLAESTALELIIPDLEGEGVAPVVGVLSGVLERAGRVPDGQAFARAALEREAVSPTDFGDGIAFPHARLPGSGRVGLALGRLRRSMVWGAHRSVPVWLVCLVAVPEAASGAYLEVISGLVRMSRSPGAIRALRGARDAGEILEVLRGLDGGSAAG